MKMRAAVIGMKVALAVVLSAGVASAGEHGGNSGGSATAVSGAAAIAVSGASASSSVMNTNTQSQGQGQGQQQNNGQSIAPSQSVKFEEPRQSPAVLAPALTSGGQNICLGSFSLGLSAWGAGAAFGKTMVDKGCERRNNAVLLDAWGHRDAALKLLMKNDEVAEVMGVKKVVETDQEVPIVRAVIQSGQ